MHDTRLRSPRQWSHYKLGSVGLQCVPAQYTAVHSNMPFSHGLRRGECHTHEEMRSLSRRTYEPHISHSPATARRTMGLIRREQSEREIAHKRAEMGGLEGEAALHIVLYSVLFPWFMNVLQ